MTVMRVREEKPRGLKKAEDTCDTGLQRPEAAAQILFSTSVFKYMISAEQKRDEHKMYPGVSLECWYAH